MSHIRWSERRGALQSAMTRAAKPPLRAAKTPLLHCYFCLIMVPAELQERTLPLKRHRIQGFRANTVKSPVLHSPAGVHMRSLFLASLLFLPASSPVAFVLAQTAHTDRIIASPPPHEPAPGEVSAGNPWFTGGFQL